MEDLKKFSIYSIHKKIHSISLFNPSLWESWDKQNQSGGIKLKTKNK